VTAVCPEVKIKDNISSNLNFSVNSYTKATRPNMPITILFVMMAPETKFDGVSL
jgi:hypothetical protein